MAIGAKVSFMKQLEKVLSAIITVSDMNKLMTAVADVSENFDMQEISVEEEHDDLIEHVLDAGQHGQHAVHGGHGCLVIVDDQTADDAQNQGQQQLRGKTFEEFHSLPP